MDVRRKRTRWPNQFELAFSGPSRQLLPVREMRGKRIALVSAMAIVTVNVWTGGPLLALWIGSRFGQSGAPSMLAIAVVATSLAVISYVLVRTLARLDYLYGQAMGRPSQVRRHVPWLRSMRGERPHEDRASREISPLEFVLITSVVIAVVAFEIWFFFFSGSPIDQRSGRG